MRNNKGQLWFGGKLVYSFDIFDTIIMRDTYQPCGIFYLMQNKIANNMSTSDYVVNNFPYLRSESENQARIYADESCHGQISLCDIYQTLKRMLGISDQEIERFMELEVETETEHLFPIKSTIKQIEDLVEKQEKVVLISDMYLGESYLRPILTAMNPIFEDIPIYVSCDYKHSKETGMLFLDVMNNEQMEPKGWVHCGDNVRTDGKIPTMLGIQTNIFQGPMDTNWKKYLMRQSELTNCIQGQVLLGSINKILREQCVEDKELVGMELGGSILFPYVYWLLDMCNQREIQRLYFLARDGYVLKQIADVIIKRYNLSIETKYVYSSRQAWQLDEDKREERELLLRYVRQEMDFTDSKFAFVDLQGTGKTMQCFAKCIKELYSGEMKVFYFMYIGGGDIDGITPISFRGNEGGMFIETLCRAPHGATIGYENNDGKVTAVLTDEEAIQWKECGIDAFVRGAVMASKEMVRSIDELRCNWIKQSIIREALAGCIYAEDQIILSYIGDMIHSSGTGKEKDCFAPRLVERDLKELALFQESGLGTDKYNGSYLELSFQRMSQSEKEKYESYTKAKALSWEKRIFNIREYIAGNIVKSKPRKRIVLYGAGKKGKKIYNYIKYCTNDRVVNWVDGDYVNLRTKGYRVNSIEDIDYKEFDYLVITIANKEVAQYIRTVLELRGIERNKILLLDQFPKALEENER